MDEGFETIEAMSSGFLKVIAEKKLRFSTWKDSATNEDKTDRMNAAAALNLMAMYSALQEAVCCDPPPCP